MLGVVGRIFLHQRIFIKEFDTKINFANKIEKSICPTRQFVPFLCNRGFCSASCLQEAPTIDIRDVEKIVDNRKIVLLDVRSASELKEEGYIPTALNLNVEDLESALKLDVASFKLKYGFQKPCKHDHVIVYCRSGKRSTRAGQILLNHNFKNVLNFKGSWEVWAEKHPEDVMAKKK